MIKKYKDFLLEENGNDSYEDPTFKTRFEKFKAALTRKTSPAAEPAASSASSSSASTPTSSSTGPGDFSNVDKMIDVVVKYLNKHGITNPIVQKAILATIGKESGFTSTNTGLKPSNPITSAVAT